MRSVTKNRRLDSHQDNPRKMRLMTIAILLTSIFFGLTATPRLGMATQNKKGWSDWKPVAEVSRDGTKLFSLDWKTFKGDNIERLEVRWRFTYHSSIDEKHKVSLVSVLLQEHRLICSDPNAGKEKQGVLKLAGRISPGESKVSTPVSITKNNCGEICSYEFKDISGMVRVEVRGVPVNKFYNWGKYGIATDLPQSKGNCPKR